MASRRAPKPCPAWLDQAKPDVVVLQEIKSVDEAFPRELFEDCGYAVETHGQKSFNGVAILSKLPLEDVQRGLPGDATDEQARWIEATVVGRTAVRICGLYLPNGNPAPGPKFDYKLAWMARMKAHAAQLLTSEAAGCHGRGLQHHPAGRGMPPSRTLGATTHCFARKAVRPTAKYSTLGFTEAFRARNSGGGYYSFWDYQAGAWERNNGIRIDHLLLSPQAADLMLDVGIDKDVRAGEKPSDHVPVWIEMDA